MFFRDKVRDGSKYLADRSSLRGHARYVILPNDETELREGIRYANKGNTKVTISGNRTGSMGGAVPNGGDVMSLEYLRGVIGVGCDDKGVFVRVQSCTTISMFNDQIAHSDIAVFTDGVEGYKDMRFPVQADPYSTVGGCISVNRSNIRDSVRRIKVVFSDSTFMTIKRGEYVAEGRDIAFAAGRNFFSFRLPSYDSDGTLGPKIHDGMDLIDLFIGSEGIFGIITEADIYVSKDVTTSDYKECGKLSEERIKDVYGQKAADELVKIKSILDTNYILNVGNLI